MFRELFENRHFSFEKHCSIQNDDDEKEQPRKIIGKSREKRKKKGRKGKRNKGRVATTFDLRKQTLSLHPFPPPGDQQCSQRERAKLKPANEAERPSIIEEYRAAR